MDAMITMLPSPSAVEEVYCGAGGALAAAGGVRPRLLLDCSTIDPPTARRVAEAAEAAPLHPEVCAGTLLCVVSREGTLGSCDLMCRFAVSVWPLHFCNGHGCRMQTPKSQSCNRCSLAGRTCGWLGAEQPGHG